MTAPQRWRLWSDRSMPEGVTVPDDLELTDDIDQADAVVVGSRQQWDATVCRRLPRLKAVVRAGVGHDNVDAASCASVGVAVCNTPDGPTVSTAEHSLGLLLAVAKKIPSSARHLRAGMGGFRETHRAFELDGRNLGVVGFGRIGSRVGRYAAALGMNVLIHDPHLDGAGVTPVGEAVGLYELWQRSDAVTIHAPATEATRHMVNAEAIAAMKPGVIIVNCARGSLVDQEALLAGLESGHVAGAGLDVTEPEPLPADHPLLARDNVIVTPHVASTTVASSARIMSQALGQAVGWLRGGTPKHLLDPAAADPAVDRRQAP